MTTPLSRTRRMPPPPKPDGLDGALTGIVDYIESLTDGRDRARAIWWLKITTNSLRIAEEHGLLGPDRIRQRHRP